MFPLDMNAPKQKEKSWRPIELISLIVSIIALAITGWFAWKAYDITVAMNNDKSQLKTLTEIASQNKTQLEKLTNISNSLYGQDTTLTSEVRETKIQTKGISNLLGTLSNVAKTSLVQSDILTEQLKESQIQNLSIGKLLDTIALQLDLENKTFKNDMSKEMYEFYFSIHYLDNAGAAFPHKGTTVDSVERVLYLNYVDSILKVPLPNKYLSSNNVLTSRWLSLIDHAEQLLRVLPRALNNRDIDDDDWSFKNYVQAYDNLHDQVYKLYEDARRELANETTPLADALMSILMRSHD